jgi:hypothetical protein
MPLAMSREDREGFLAEPHVGVPAVADGGGPPLVSPVCVLNRPDGGAMPSA